MTTAAKGPRLLTTIGHEEGRRLPEKTRGIVDALCAGWSFLFGDAVRLDNGPAPTWPSAFAQPRPSAPIFPFLPNGDVDIGWWPTGVAAFGTSDAIAKRVHDKAFATAIARRRADAFEWSVALAPEDCREENVRRVVENWPDWAAQTWTLKPRLGTSGRGRVRGDGKGPVGTRVENGLARFATAGGCIVEPWVKRTADYSAHVFVDAEKRAHWLGSLLQWTTTPGVCVGLEGVWDGENIVPAPRPASKATDDLNTTLRANAFAVAAEAADVGYRGLLGIDSFAFETPSGERLRAFVEVNARFTMGSIAIGLAHRAREAGCVAKGDAFSVSLTQQALDGADEIFALTSSSPGTVAPLHGKHAAPGLTLGIRRAPTL